MNNAQFETYCKKAGLTTFVAYFEFFISNLTNAEIRDIMMEYSNYTKDSAKTRISKSRTLIKAGKTKTILERVANSNHHTITTEVKDAARHILHKIELHIITVP